MIENFPVQSQSLQWLVMPLYFEISMCTLVQEDDNVIWEWKYDTNLIPKQESANFNLPVFSTLQWRNICMHLKLWMSMKMRYILMTLLYELVGYNLWFLENLPVVWFGCCLVAYYLFSAIAWGANTSSEMVYIG